MTLLLKDREHAGEELSKVLKDYSNAENTIVLGLPRGGVPIAKVIADKLSLPLDVLLVRKLGVPGQEELAMGAIAVDKAIYLNHSIINRLKIHREQIDRVIQAEREELQRRNELYRNGRESLELEGKDVIVVDDGLATGATMKASVSAIKEVGVNQIIVAVPLGAPSSCNEIAQIADKVYCLHTPDPFYGVGRWYETFDQITDDEVVELLN